MKQAVIDEIVRAGYAGHGCHRGRDGRCYYLCSLVNVRDYGNQRGCTFQAFIEDHRGKLEVVTTFVFSLTRSALATDRVKALIRANENYLRSAGLARFKALLDQHEKLDPHYKLLLNSDATDAELAIPQGLTSLQAMPVLRSEILRNLALLHDEGHQQLSLAMLLDRLCTRIDWIDIALRTLIEQQFVKDVHGYLVLTTTGHLEAEKTVSIHPEPSARPTALTPTPSILPFDCFISYAREVRTVVEKLVSALKSRGLRVWWDKGQITIGDSLTRKLEEGLSQSRYGIVIVSTHSIVKKWPDAEVRALANRAITTGAKVVLPVLVGITHDEYAAAYPLLADLVSVTLDRDYQGLADEIVRAMRHRN